MEDLFFCGSWVLLIAAETLPRIHRWGSKFLAFRSSTQMGTSGLDINWRYRLGRKEGWTEHSREW
jgi:hypothetical protein